uniref:ATP synthase peripheral stalk subunit OSCP, mitochondrial n=1 Tax=Canis lupus familiaris TaxID=9615 RepID=A0A8C0PRE6_CANLF
LAALLSCSLVDRGFPRVATFSFKIFWSALVRLPVQVYGIEGRYATALYSAASKQNKLEQVEKELLRVAQILKEPKIAASIMNPHVKRSVKVKSLNDMTARERFSPGTSNPINLLAGNGRLNNTPGVISAFSTMMSVHRGEGPSTLTELKTVLKSSLSKGQVLELEVKVDPSILGGMIVRIAEKYAEMSARTKIQKLSSAMREAVR